MGLIIQGYAGQIFHAQGHPDLLKVRLLYCFVPDGMDLSAYAESRWPSVNAGANPNAIGSHVFPDLQNPVSNKNCPTLKLFLTNLPKYIAKTRS